MSDIVNKVANSSLVNFDLDEHVPIVDLASIDIAPQLWQGLALREKDFRTWIKSHDWTQYQDQNIAIYCSADAIIPMWAYMLITAAVQPYAKFVHVGLPDSAREVIILNHLEDSIDMQDYLDARVVVNGCADRFAPPSVYAKLVSILQPVAKSIMFGEACSTVPVWKAPK